MFFIFLNETCVRTVHSGGEVPCNPRRTSARARPGPQGDAGRGAAPRRNDGG